MKEKTLKTLEYYKIVELLVEKAESSLGREKAKEIRPLTDIDDIEYLQRETEEAYSLIIKRGNPPLFGIYNIGPEVRRAEMGGVISPGSLLKIADSLRVSRTLKGYMRETKEDKASSYPIIEGLVDDLRVYRHIEEEIDNAIVSENEISDNASPALRSIRKQIASKNEAIKDKLNAIVNSQSYRKYLQDSIITVREGRYVIPVKAENRGNVPGLVHDMSGSGATLL